MKPIRYYIFGGITAGLLTCMAGNANAQTAAVPRQMSYQGVLREGDKVVPDGKHALLFKLYTTESGGQPIWQETQLITMTGGLFNVTLGVFVDLPAIIPKDAWIGISINNSAELIPRTKLMSAPYSFNAGTAQSLSPTATGAVLSLNGQQGAIELRAADGLEVRSDKGILTIGKSSQTKEDEVLNQGTEWVLAGNGNATANSWLGTSNNIPLIIRTSNAERMRILSSNGNVGIGETAPNSRLSVARTLHITNTGGTPELKLSAPSGANSTTFKTTGQSADITYTLPPTDGDANDVLMSNGTGVLTWAPGGWGIAGNAGTATHFIGTTNNQPFIVRTNNIERYRVTGGGALGINEDNPTQKLEVAGNIVVKTDGSGTGELRLQEQSGGMGNNYTAFRSGNMPMNITYTLPTEAPLPGEALMANAGNVLTWGNPVASGSAGGDLTGTYPNPEIAAGVIVNADINAAAAIDYSKLNLSGAIQGSDIASGIFTTVNSHIALSNNDDNARELRLLEPSGSGTNYTAFKAQGQTSDITYTLPSADGTSGQVLTTNGSGVLSWNTIALQHFSESVNTTAPNAGVPVVQFLANNAALNVDIALTPKGTGALTAQVADGTATGGNKRGENAVDWQMSRGLASQVASGLNSTISGGNQNTASGPHTTVSGGEQNIANFNSSTVGGGYRNQATHQASTVGGGNQNTASGSEAVVGGGYLNIASNDYSTVSGGNQNTANGFLSTVGGGNFNHATNQASTVSGGNGNTAGGFESSVGGGLQNTASGDFSAVPGGRGLTLDADADRSFGFHGNTSAGDRDMTISAANTAVFGNVDLWIASNDNTPKSLRFYEQYDAAGNFPNGSNYVGFRAPNSIVADVTWTLPDADGTSGQVLSTNGSGTLSWTTAAGGLSNFTESVNTAAPNATVPVVRLLATNAATNVDIALTPKGTGALTAQVADNAVSGGNKRGQNAVDWQMIRNSASQVASGHASTVSGGQLNTASGARSTVGGGQQNTASGNLSTVSGGESNIANNLYSTVSGGETNTASGIFSTVSGGSVNTASSAISTVSGGYQNIASNYASTIGGGYQNTASGDYSAIPGGYGLTLDANADRSFGFNGNTAAGDRNMTISAANTAVFGNVDLWLASNDNTPKSLRFYEQYNTTGTFPNGSNYVGFRAPNSIAADVTWTLPAADGTSGQVLTTNGSGTLSWANDGVINFTSNRNATAPNNTRPVHQLIASGTETNIDIALTPKATGALTAQVADGTATGGNKRGQYAVDWQMLRLNATEVASASYSTIGGGAYNTANNLYSTVSGGAYNTANNLYSTVSGGLQNTANNLYSTVSGGSNNTASGNSSTVSGGFGNTASGNSSTVSGGQSNIANNLYSTVSGGQSNIANNLYSTVSGGLQNTASGSTSAVSGGLHNTASGYASAVSGGEQNIASGEVSTVSGGSNNTASGNASTVSGGVYNTASDLYSTVSGGSNNTASGSNSTVSGGFQNTASGNISTVSGGQLNTASGDYSAVPGGRGLTLDANADRSFGFHGNTSAGDRDMTISAANTAVFGNVDLWLASNDNTPKSLRFYEQYNTAGTFPNGSNYVGFRAPNSIAADVTWTLPAADGTSGQVLTTNGSGVLTWANDGVINFTSNRNTTAPNTTVPVHQLIASGTGDDIDIALTPKGSGALTAQVADGTATGGNKRGFHAVDWQLIRSSASQVASGTYSTISGGLQNRASGLRSSIGGGFSNTASGDYSTVSGGIQNTSSGTYSTVSGFISTASGSSSTVGGGQQNTASGSSSTVGGGGLNNASDDYSTIGGGQQNTASGSSSTVGGGGLNNASDNYSTIGGGEENTASGNNSSIIGGYRNTASGDWSTIGGGLTNQASGNYSIIGGGSFNTASGDRTTVSGGYINTANGDYSAVSGGYNNTADGTYSTVGGGVDNTASGNYSTVLGGNNNTANGDFNLVFGNAVDPSVTESYRIYFFDGASSGRLALNRENADHPIHVGTNNINGNGAHLTDGGTWTNGSSADFKERFTSLDGDVLLKKLDQLDVKGWYYKGTNEYHIGPIAEQFYSLFQTGDQSKPEQTEKYISSVDPSGVALAAVKELIKRVETLSERNQSLEKHSKSLEEQNKKLMEAMEEIKAMLKK